MLVRHVEGESAQSFHHPMKAQALCLQSNVYWMDHAFLTHRSGYGWVWRDDLGNEQSSLHTDLEALIWVTERMLQFSACQLSENDSKDLLSMIQEPAAWWKYSTERKESASPKSISELQNHLLSIGAKLDRWVLSQDCIIEPKFTWNEKPKWIN